MAKIELDFRWCDFHWRGYEAFGGPLCGLKLPAELERIVLEYDDQRVVYEQEMLTERTDDGHPYGYDMRFIVTEHSRKTE